jgi:Tfp pilus assembly protein PilO
MASGAMADFARMPTQRKVMLFAAIAALLGLAYWKLAYKSLEEDLEAAQTEHDNKVKTNRRLAADIPAYEELRTQMTRLRQLIEKNQTALPSAPELPAFFETLQHKVAESGVEIRKWTNRPEEPVETFIKVPVEIEITGTFLQIKRFFASLVQRDVRPAQGEEREADPERIVSIENLALTNPTIRNREILLSARFTAVTFRQEERVEAAKPAGAAQRPAAPAAPVAPPPPLPSAPLPSAPLPSAPLPTPSPATPAGAKASVESSIEKGDARNRNAPGAAEAKPADGKDKAGTGSGSARLKGGI